MYTMEHPFFSLRTGKDLRIRKYTHNGQDVNITPSVLGMPTMIDKDVLVFCISRIKKAMNEGHEQGPMIRFIANDFFSLSGKRNGGTQYTCLVDSLNRLSGVRVQTTIQTNKTTIDEGFGLIEKYKIIKRANQHRTMMGVEITLSEWLYNSIVSNEILTLSPLYFSIKRPLKKRIYELARKHCGKQPTTEIALTLLHKKSGTAGTIKEFRRKIRCIEKENDLPDYFVNHDKQTDRVVFSRRHESDEPTLRPDTHEKVRQAFIKKKGRCLYDIHALHADWIDHWRKHGEQHVTNPDGAFYAFCMTTAGLAS